MHESAAQSILEHGSAKLKEIPNADAVLSIHVIIGEDSRLKAEPLQIAFDRLKSLYTGCEQCKLDMAVVHTQALCQRAKHSFSPSANHSFCCDKCGDSIGSVICGEELEVIKVILHASEARNHQ